MEEPFGLMAEDFYQTMGRIFSAEGAFEERGKWQDLSPAYARWKQKHYPGRKILELTGRMKLSLVARGSSENVTQITSTEMSLGTVVPYAIFHQKGTPNMPMRKVIEITSEEKLRWVQIMHKYMVEVNKTISDVSRS
jgi:phage gpG-like protein